MPCPQCELLYINGIKCHEHGCPEAYKDELVECAWCGQPFKLTKPSQELCSDDCLHSYYN